MTPSPSARADKFRKDQQLTGLMSLKFNVRMLIGIFPNANPAQFEQIMQEYTGLSKEPDFQYIRSRAKVMGQLEDLLFVIRKDPDLSAKFNRILRLQRPIDRVTETRRTFRIYPTLARLVLKLIEAGAPQQ